MTTQKFGIEGVWPPIAGLRDHAAFDKSVKPDEAQTESACTKFAAMLVGAASIVFIAGGVVGFIVARLI